jgi:tetratricopeptide (TPR) repeat protein
MVRGILAHLKGIDDRALAQNTDRQIISQQDRSAADRLFAEGEKLAAQQAWQAALGKFQQALPIFQTNGHSIQAALTVLRIANMYEELKQCQEALGFYQQALAFVRAQGNKEFAVIMLNKNYAQ